MKNILPPKIGLLIVLKILAQSNDPVISVDYKKKDLIGQYKTNGQEWSLPKNPTEVNMCDFIGKTNGEACPYGVYRGCKNVGISSDTASFAVSTIRDCCNNHYERPKSDSKPG